MKKKKKTDVACFTVAKQLDATNCWKCKQFHDLRSKAYNSAAEKSGRLSDLTSDYGKCYNHEQLELAKKNKQKKEMEAKYGR